jgi:hypothetical protein
MTPPNMPIAKTRTFGVERAAEASRDAPDYRHRAGGQKSKATG